MINLLTSHAAATINVKKLMGNDEEAK